MVKYPSESSEQSAFVSWFRGKYPELVIFSVPNGGTRNAIEGKKLKKEGCTAGVLDLVVLMPSGKTLFIEFKRQRGGTVSASQKAFMSELDRLGFDYFVAYGFKDGAEKFSEYYRHVKTRTLL